MGIVTSISTGHHHGAGPSSAPGTHEGQHFVQIVNPSKAASLVPERTIKLGSDPAGPGQVEISARAKILKFLCATKLWENFLDSSANSFALTQAEATALILDSVFDHNPIDGSKLICEEGALEKDVKAYISLLEELNERDGSASSKTIDFMSLCSSVLLLSKQSIEFKTDTLFSWIAIGPESAEFGFEDFFVALKSFERGVSHALGQPACSESYVKAVAQQWIALADPEHRSSGSISNIRINNKNFFSFCTNRQHVVRKLLEALAICKVHEDKNLQLQEVGDALDQYGEPTGGDEWMANPAWKKIASSMVPEEFKQNAVVAALDTKPASNLTLEWVHGYRGFDCRNNLYFADEKGEQVLFSAAALTVVQTSPQDGRAAQQFFFGEHGDDILSITSCSISNGQTLIASGEIGKTPAIHLYSWDAEKKSFQSIACMKGFHTKGVTQLTFSEDGTVLFSVGVDYTVAAYNTAPGDPNVGKMIASSQGPKGKVMHVARTGRSAGGKGKLAFLSVGEKHAVLWKLDNALKQETCKLGSYRNKMLLSAASSVDGMTLIGTSEGDLIACDGTSTAAAVLKGSSGHGKKAINALWTNGGGDIVVSGDRDGKVIVWRATAVRGGSNSGATMSLASCVELLLEGFTQPISIDGCTNAAGVDDAKAKKAPSKPSASVASVGKGKKRTKAATGGKDIEEDDTSGRDDKAPPVRSVALSQDGKHLLVGTQSCEVLQYSLGTGNTFADNNALVIGGEALSNNIEKKLATNVLVTGHFKDEVWGLAVRPVTAENSSDKASDVEYATVGDDGYLRIWSLREHRLLGCARLNGIARACDYSPDGNYLAIGFGGRTGKKNGKNREDGMVKVLRLNRSNDGRLESFTQVCELKEAKQWISVVRYSPDGSTLAVGSRDNSIYLYSVMHQYKRKGKFPKHNAGINQLDFTVDGRYLQSCCSAYEILFSDATNGAQVTNGARKLLGEPFSTFTCTLGWSVIGIWSGAMDGSDVNAVSRSPSGRLLASCDDFGQVNVFRYPAVKEGGSDHSVYTGHSSHVTSVRWASILGSVPSASFKPPATDDYLISIGGEDKCVFQWRNEGHEGDKLRDATIGASDASASTTLGGFQEDALLDGPSGGDEFTAVKPWLGAIVAPSAWQSPESSKKDLFMAALGELSTYHGSLTQSAQKAMEQQQQCDTSRYNEVQRATEETFKRMSESGVVNPTAPDGDELQLEWVYGYRGFDCRNNLFYVENKLDPHQRSIVYFAAALGIVMNPIKRTQQYFKGHDDDIVSMAVHKAHTNEGVDALVATGQEGKGKIFVWEVPSMCTAATIDAKQKNVTMLSFSSDGRRIISIAEDKTVAVSDWQSQTVLTNTKGEPAPTLGLAVGAGTTPDGASGTDLCFVSCGDKHIRFWTLSGRNLTAGKVVTSKCPGAKVQSYVCAAGVHGHFIIGCEDGSLYIIPPDGKAVTHRIGTAEADNDGAKKGKPKTSPILSMCLQEEKNRPDSDSCLLITGAGSGTITVWETKSLADALSGKGRKPTLTRLYAFPIDSLGIPYLVAKHVRAVGVTNNEDDTLRLLLGTRGCDICEVDCNIFSGEPSASLVDSSSGIIMQGHCNDELWGVATHPSKPEFCTVGDDKTLRFFSLHQRKMLWSEPLGFIARCCDYGGNDGSLVAVGFGGRLGRGKEKGGGIVRIYSADHKNVGVKKLAERTDAKEWISDVKFSADSQTLAVGAHDCKIYIYDIKLSIDGEAMTVQMDLRAKFVKHNSVINHLDLSADGRFMQSNCSAYELLFCDTSNGKQIPAASELKDVQWRSWTCPLGWPVQGIWSGNMDGSDINAVCRSHSGHLLATSDDFGKVNLFRYPAVQEESDHLSYSGHSSHVMNVRWTVGDECLLSCGGKDKCIMQWRHIMSASASTPLNEPDDDAVGAVSTTSPNEESTNALFDFGDGPGGGDEAGAVKPWVGAIRAPKHPAPISTQPPAVDLCIKWVHGYTSAAAGSKNTKISSNLFYNSDCNPVYPAAALAVMLESVEGDADTVKEQKQSYFIGHDDDILCLTMSPDRRYVATGQTASKSSKGKGSVIVWDALQGRQLSRMDGCHQRAVTSLAFSPNSTQLLSVGQDDSNTHIIWKDMGGGWSRVQKLAESKGDKAPVLFSRWVHLSNPKAQTAEFHFLSGGAAGVNFWKLQGSSLSKKQGKFGSKYKSSPLLCGANLQGKDGVWRMVLGTSKGDLFMYEDREVCNAVEGAHKGPALCLAEGGPMCMYLVSGGRDGMIKVWNQALQPISVFSVASYATVNESVASLDVKPVASDDHSKLTLLVGTYGGEILELSSTTDADEAGDSGSNSDYKFDITHAQVQVLLHSHYSGELWGLATHPLDSDIVATVGDDGTLRVWSIKMNRMLAMKQMNWPARSVAWHPSGTAVAVGFHEAVKGGYKNSKGVAKKKSKEASKDSDPGSASSAHKGAIQIFSVTRLSAIEMDLTFRAAGCSSLAWINDIKFSPDGSMLCAGSHDKRLYAYSIPDLTKGDESDWSDPAWDNCLRGKPKFEFNKHSSAVLHFDFSLDGRYFQSNCQASELLFGHLDTGKQETSASKLADYNNDLLGGSTDDMDDGAELRVWASQTCKLGWPVQGIWEPGMDTTDINSVDRNVTNKLLATADDFGKVRIFRYPCVQEGSKFVASCDAHSSHVTCVRWAINGNVLASVGGNDKCLFLWDVQEK